MGEDQLPKKTVARSLVDAESLKDCGKSTIFDPKHA